MKKQDSRLKRVTFADEKLLIAFGKLKCCMTSHMTPL